MKKHRKYNTVGVFLLLMTMSLGLMFQSCDEYEGLLYEEYPNKFELDDGVPNVNYIRLNDPTKSDSLIVSASLNNVIALIGNDLNSISELWFNDQQAYLNTSYITSNALIVSIPDQIPITVTNKIYMVTEKDTITHDFKVLVPRPSAQSMLCEFVADGEVAVINGSYFIDEASVPLQVIFPGELEGEVLSVSANYDEISVKVPVGAGSGPLKIKGIYGSSFSSFNFRDDRNYILDWDNLDAAGSWNPGVIRNSDPEGITGNYAYFEGDQNDGGWLWKNELMFIEWNKSNGRPDVPFYEGDLSKAVLKFEVNVLEDWKSAALQMMFTPYDMYNDISYFYNLEYPRGLWMPWASSGSYKTEGWRTISIPMSEFNQTSIGTGAGSTVTTEMLGGLSFFVWNGGVAGEECRVRMCIDNIRIVPM